MKTLPNIPSVQSSIDDRTIQTQVVATGRAPLVLHFSKYGKEDFREFSNYEYFLYQTGAVDPEKYGLGSVFIRDALTETNKVVAKRLLPSDATFANISISTEGDALTYDYVKSSTPEKLFEVVPFLQSEPLDTTSIEWDKWNTAKEAAEAAALEKMQLVIGHVAQGRGSGYNDIFITYSAAPEYEKMDSNLKGDANYRFNFIKAEIFEKTKTGYKQLGDPFVFSLIDKDLDTNELVKDQLSGFALFANTVTPEANDFVNIYVNDLHLPELRKIRNINDLMPDGRLIVPDINNNGTESDKYYEVKSELNSLKQPVVVVEPTEDFPTISPRIGYSRNLYPFVDPSRDEITATIINSSAYDFRHANNIAKFTDSGTVDAVTPEVAVIATTDATGKKIFKALINVVQSENVIVPIKISGVGPFGFSIDSDPMYLDTMTILAGKTEAVFNPTSYYGGEPQSMNIMIITPETDPTNVFGLNVYPHYELNHSRIDVRKEFSVTTNAYKHRYSAAYGVAEPLIPRISIELSSSSGTNAGAANYHMVHDVILEKPLASGTGNIEVTVDYEVQTGSVTETVELLLTLEPDASNPTKTIYTFDFSLLVKNYFIPVYMYKDIYVDNKVLKFSNIENVSATQTRESFFIDGTDGFYEFSFNPLTSTNEFLLNKHDFLRHSIYEKLVGSSVKLWNGTDGKYLINTNGKLNIGGSSEEGKENAKDCLLNALKYNKDLQAVLYPKFTYEYLPTWCEDVDVINAGIALCDTTELAFGIHSIPTTYDVNYTIVGQEDKDLEVRKNYIYTSSTNNMLITSQRNKSHTDIFTGDTYYMPASYYALMNRLKIDDEISITEPAANIEKGAIRNSRVNLQYSPSAEYIEKLRNAQINSIIIENDGTYFIDQLTMFKKSSKLNNINTVITLQQLRKDLPKVLKPFLQLKEIAEIEERAVNAALAAANKWVITKDNITNGLFEYVTVTPYYNRTTKRLRLSMTVSPVGTFEVIEVPIMVV